MILHIQKLDYLQQRRCNVNEGSSILVVTNSRDTTAAFVINRMIARQINHIRLDTDKIAQGGNTLSIDINNLSKPSVIANGVEINRNQIRSVWLRRYTEPEVSFGGDEEAEKFSRQEYDFALKWFLGSLECFFLDTEEDMRRGRNKINQLLMAKRLGLEIPRTLITNDPGEAKLFLEASPLSIAKSIGGFGKRKENGFEGVYTIRLTEEKIKTIDAISLAPICMQEEIQKAYELRITIVGTKIFSCRIDSQKSPKTRIDWRRYDVPNTPHSQHAIPEEISSKLIEMMREFNVHFASFDLIVTPEGRYIFLEMNPNSQWVWIEELTGLPITDALIDELCV